MRTLAIVKAEVRPQIVQRVWWVAVILEIDVFVFDGSPQPLDENIVEGASPAIHADQDILGFESSGKCVAGELRTLIGVENVGRTMPQGMVESRAAKCRVQARRDFPTQYVTAEPVHDRDQLVDGLGSTLTATSG